MRMVKLKSFGGWPGTLVWHCGLGLLVTALWFMRYNIVTTAAAMAGLFGGVVGLDETADVWLPSIVITKGGALGLGFCYAVGISFSLLEMIFWGTDDNSLGEQANMVQTLGTVVLIADIGSAMYALMGGPAAYTMFMQDWVAFAQRFVASLFVTGMFLSVGSEFWLILSFESLRVYWKPAKEFYAGLFQGIGNLIKGLLEWWKKSPTDKNPPPQTQSRRAAVSAQAQLAFGGGEEEDETPQRRPGQNPQYRPVDRNGGGRP